MTLHVHTSTAALVLLALPSQTESRRPFVPTLPHPNRQVLAALEVRGGGLFGSSKSDEEEWEYYQEDEETDQEIVAEAGDNTAINDEYEYYDNESYGRVQDLNGAFVDSSDADVQWEEADNEEMESEQADDDDSDDEEFLMSTPIPNKKENMPSRDWFGLDKRSKSTAASVEELANQDEATTESEKDSNLEGANEPSDYLLVQDQDVETTPSKSWFGISKSSTATVPEAESLDLDEAPNVKSKTNSKSKQPKQWTQPKPKAIKPKKRRRKTNKQILSRSSSGASFIYPINKLTSMVQNLPSASLSGRSGGRNIIATTINSFSRMTAAIIQPILLVITTVVSSTTSFIVKWASIILALMRQAVDALWYGPVDGVTTTGISRAGGFSGLFLSSPLIGIASCTLVVSFVILVRQQMTNQDSGRKGHVLGDVFTRFRSKAETTQNEEEDEFYDTDDSEPSPEEELQFLNSFDAANPTSRERISKKISKRMWPFNASQKPTPRQEKRQHQRSIKSIQKWWKQRPSNTIQIIEPSHVQQPPLSQQIARLKNQLAQSEQERAVLQSDVARLQHRLQQAHHDAKAIVSKNQWLEKQQSKADKILAKAVEIERRQANNEMEMVRESMKGVLEREKMLMRGRLAENLRSIRFRRDEPEQNNTYIESRRSVIEEERSDKEEGMDSNGYKDDESIWGGRQSSIHRNPNINYG
ncbi:hypothetical protein ACHAXN_004872 [Cyclotella atomus]